MHDACRHYISNCNSLNWIELLRKIEMDTRVVIVREESININLAERNAKHDVRSKRENAKMPENI